MEYDLVRRKEAINALCDECYGKDERCENFPCGEVKALKNLLSAQPNNQVHLCDSCRYIYPECPSEKDDVIFGNGKGNDNICACNKYEPFAPELIRCKDCKYWHREMHNGIEYFNFSSCDLNHCGDGRNFYCADAERKDGKANE